MGNKILFIIHLIITAYMVGVIWVIQVIHYPLFSLVGKEQFVDYEREHIKRVSFIIAIPMALELATFIGLAYLSDFFRKGLLFWISGGLIFLIWSVSFFISVPQHKILSLGFDEKAYKTLVKTNWIRTISWSLRLALLYTLM